MLIYFFFLFTIFYFCFVLVLIKIIINKKSWFISNMRNKIFTNAILNKQKSCKRNQLCLLGPLISMRLLYVYIRC